MKPRILFRDDGHAIRTESDIDWGWGCFAAAVLVIMLSWGGRFDATPADQLQAVVDARSGGFAAGRAAGREDAAEEATERLTKAYEFGLQDGLYASTNRPEGLALVQACMALERANLARAGAAQ